MRAATDPYGNFLPTLLYHDLRDRLAGRRACASARWGRLARPGHAGKLIWICSGRARKSVRLGVELARAIVAKRLDVTVTLTFEAEFADLLAPLAKTPRIGWGFGPADYAASMRALWRRWMPFALVVAGIAPRRNLLAAAAQARHALLVAPPIPVTGRFERVYPTHSTPCPGPHSAPCAELDTLLIAAAVEPALAAALTAGRARRVWWWHGADATQALRFIALFRGHLPGDLLVLSGPICRAPAIAGETILRLSAWERGAISRETLVLADEPRSLPVLAACASGAHFAVPEPDALWQALAGGACVSAAGSVDVASSQLIPTVGLVDDESDVAMAWAALRADPVKARIAADASRGAFLAERRLAQDAIVDLLDRVLGWS